ncbi:hypothetical protein EPUS_06142 [Endocarpon pusillum Z07020]|uniref:Uncharacterized protein n=1 Tax=Endocarpon pusillum (strain Z07020 / HMAS-L-300199) TaxID=1263415 RepID=U1HZW2_ENDPU|nr:uncharacterized protein EPUS_06142 [Endocarpon pusillum Z07020]ERF76480.1 hypothetical protein EPUS_06142 [Endocarpon pusillum Z07020]
MSSASLHPSRVAGGSSRPTPRSGAATSSCAPRRHTVTPPSTPLGAAAHQVSLRQKAELKCQSHNGGASPSEPALKQQSELLKLNASVKPHQATPAIANGDVPPEPSIGNTKALSTETMDNLPPTLRNFVLKGKTAIVTGGARGLGLAMSQALCEAGIKAVAIFDIQPKLGQSVAQSLHTATGIPVKYHNVDITNESNVEAAVKQVIQQFGGIDILINSAGVAFSNLPAEKQSLDIFRKTIDINLTGSYIMAQVVGRYMIKTTPKATSHSHPQLPDRSIIFIASMSGSIVNYPQRQSAYNTSKAAVIMLSKCLAAEWAEYGIRVNTISPGYMDTVLNRTPELTQQKVTWKQRTPLGRLGKEEELNNVMVWLAGEGARFVTGGDYKVDGGYSVY